MKITLPLAGSDGTTKVIEAEIVDVAPHLAHVATFAVGPSIWPTGFVLHNVESGCRISSTLARTKARCRELAVTALSYRTEREVQTALRKAQRYWNKLQSSVKAA